MSRETQIGTRGIMEDAKSKEAAAKTAQMICQEVLSGLNEDLLSYVISAVVAPPRLGPRCGERGGASK